MMAFDHDVPALKRGAGAQTCIGSEQGEVKEAGFGSDFESLTTTRVCC